MKPSQALNLHCEEIRRIVASHKATNPRVFGSVLHGEDTEESDLDLLVDPIRGMTLFDVAAIIQELEQLLGVRVDVVTLGDVSPKSRVGVSSKFREQVLAEALPLSDLTKILSGSSGGVDARMNRKQQRLTNYLEHILEAIERVREYTEDVNKATFLQKKMMQAAVIRELEIIGEASRNIEVRYPEFAKSHPNLPLALAYKLRNAVSHGYDEVDLATIWDTINDDLPDLYTQVEELLKSLKVEPLLKADQLQ